VSDRRSNTRIPVNVAKARALSNPDLSPHLSFVDLAGHGYATVRVTPNALETEFVVHSAAHRAQHVTRWRPVAISRVASRQSSGSAGNPKLEQRVLEGRPDLSM
jgi:alkaline phosphatase D